MFNFNDIENIKKAGCASAYLDNDWFGPSKYTILKDNEGNVDLVDKDNRGDLNV